MNETIYYQEGDDFISRRVFTKGEHIDLAPVTVASGVLKVGNDTYTLAGVQGSKLDVLHERMSEEPRKSIKTHRLGIIASCALALAGGIFVHYAVLLCFGVAFYEWRNLVKARMLEKIVWQYVGRLVLTRNGTDTFIVISRWNPFPDDMSKEDLAGLGYDVEYRHEQYDNEKRRAEMIAQAVGKAISEKSPVGAS